MTHETPAPQLISKNVVNQSEQITEKLVSNQAKSRMSEFSNAYDDKPQSDNYFINQNVIF
jgi:hypothetical protein